MENPSRDEMIQEIEACRTRIQQIKREISDLNAKQMELEQQLEDVKKQSTAKTSELQQETDLESNLCYGFTITYGR